MCRRRIDCRFVCLCGWMIWWIWWSSVPCCSLIWAHSCNDWSRFSEGSGVNGASVWSRRKEYWVGVCCKLVCVLVSFERKEGEWVWQVVNWEISLLNAVRGFYGLNTRSRELWRSDTDMVFHFHSFLSWMRGWLCRVDWIRLMIIMLKEWNAHMEWRNSSESSRCFHSLHRVDWIYYIQNIESSHFHAIKDLISKE